MTRTPARFLGLVPLVLATSLVACASGTPAVAPPAPAAAASVAPPATGPVTPPGVAPAQAGKKAPAAPPAVVAASIQKSLARVARPIADPAAGKTFKASQYWDYELGTPFEVEDTTITGLGDTDKDGRTEIKIVSDVKLPNGKMQTKLMLLGRYALTQVDEETEDDLEADDDAAGDDGDEVVSDEEGDAADDADSADDPDADEAGTDDTPDDADGDDTTAEVGDDEAFDFDEWETEIDLAELDEEIGEADDDITWEDDWLVDADGDGEWEAGDAEAYAEEFSEEEEDLFLTAPHQCEMSIQDADAMSNQDDLVTVTDKDTGETLTISYDQEWVHFTIKTSAGEGKIEYLPDGSYLLDGQPVGDIEALAERLREQAYFRVTSRYTLGLLAGRLGRRENLATRATTCKNGLGYRLNQGGGPCPSSAALSPSSTPW